MSILHGLLERISYHNEENSFVVAKLREKDKRELTTIIGNLSGVNPGESLC
jgi:exodeoxyribonuclease V alpha subunit